MKNIYVIGSGFQGLKISTIFSSLKGYKVHLFSDSKVFIFTPYVASMLYKKNYFDTDINNFCRERSIDFVNEHIIDINKDLIISKNKKFKINGTLFDCRNNLKKLINTKEFSNHDRLSIDIQKINNSNKKFSVIGHNIQALEIALALKHVKKLKEIISNKQIKKNEYIKALKSTSFEDLNFILKKDLKSKEISSQKINYSSLSAQEASQMAKRLALKELKWVKDTYKLDFKKRGLFIQTGINNAEIFIFNFKKSFMHGLLIKFLRDSYYFIQYNIFYKEKKNKFLIYSYLLYLKIYSFFKR